MTQNLDDGAVVAYLKNHPDFFSGHLELLTQLHVPNQHGGRAISIGERQLIALRERNRQLESKLSELIGFGEENDTISERVHLLAVALAAAENFTSVVHDLYAHLGGTFVVPHVALRLWGAGHGGTLPELAECDEETRIFAADLHHSYCGSSAGLEALAWLGSGVRSLALVPLRRGDETIGLLTLGSEDETRFYPEMGTLYLDRIGDLASAALLRTLR